MYKYFLVLHIVAATVWTGGHLVLAVTILPKALRRNAPEMVFEFDSGFERIAIPALLLLVVTGLWLAYRMIPDVSAWFSFENYVSTLIVTKLTLLALTVALAIDARIRIVPNIASDNLKRLAFHIIPVTIISVILVIIGVGFRTGGAF
ncbi:MAG: CopD family protein [Bacteroidota bacterium]